MKLFKKKLLKPIAWIAKATLCEFISYVEAIVIAYPESSVGFFLRKIYWKRKFKSCESIRQICQFVRFFNPGEISIGKGAIFRPGVTVDASDSHGIFIGNNVAIADSTYIRSGNHRYKDAGRLILEQGHTSKSIRFKNNTYSIVIENDVWIGAGAILVSGAHMCEGVVIGAGARISERIPPYSVVIGNPSRIISKRKVVEA